MRKLWTALREFFRKGDLLLLFICVLTSVFGIVVIASATRYMGSSRQVLTQSAALMIGILVFVAVSLIDVELLAEYRLFLMAFNYLFVLLLLFFGKSRGNNRAWLSVPGLPFDVQPAEICKITFIIVLAKTMSIYQNQVSSLRSVGSIGLQTAIMAGLILVISKDMGSALVYVFIFLLMAYLGGIRGWWFLGGAAAVAAVGPYAWEHVLREDQIERIMMIFDPTIDPTGQGVRWDTNRSINMISGGGIAGQGLFRGALTQNGAIDAQHTDFIFSTIGEELGILGCILTMLLLTAIIARCIHTGLKTPNYMNRLICFGVAAMLAFQILINTGMCIGVMPVIGLTLPFISYGGSSLITLFLAMGVVSSIHMRPDPESASPYVQAKY